MATQGIVNGTDVRITMVNSGAANVIAYSTSCAVSISHSPRSTTNSTSGAYATKMAGLIEWEIEVSAMMSMSGATGYKWYQIWLSWMETREVFRVYYKTFESGDRYFYGDVIMTGMSMENPNEESSTFSCSFAGSGVLNLGVI
tara:strand:+ start:753 stop:1181 length:429 start_codon:yes stop_codon:yes gene_type:complete